MCFVHLEVVYVFDQRVTNGHSFDEACSNASRLDWIGAIDNEEKEISNTKMLNKNVNAFIQWPKKKTMYTIIFSNNEEVSDQNSQRWLNVIEQYTEHWSQWLLNEIHN